MYLLDTSQCSLLLLGWPGAAERLDAMGRAQVATCVIVIGELFYMAYKSDRDTANVPLVESLIQSMVVHPIDVETTRVYGSLKGRLLDRFGPESAPRDGVSTPPGLDFQTTTSGSPPSRFSTA